MRFFKEIFLLFSGVTAICSSTPFGPLSWAVITAFIFNEDLKGKYATLGVSETMFFIVISVAYMNWSWIRPIEKEEDFKESALFQIALILLAFSFHRLNVWLIGGG